MKLSPTTVENRIEALDITRGFALLGIFIANMLFFHTPYLHVDPYSWFINGDAATFKWIDIFVQGSFYPIFALLFGYGINMQYEKSIQRNIPIRPCHGEAIRDIAWHWAIAWPFHLVRRCIIHVCGHGFFVINTCSDSCKMACLICRGFVHYPGCFHVYLDEVIKANRIF